MKRIKIGGEDRPVCYTINALIEFEELTNIDILQGAIDPVVFSKLKNIRALAYCGLKHGWLQENTGEVPFNLEDVGKWAVFGDGSMNKFIESFTEETSSGEEPKEVEEGAEVKK